MPIARPLSKNPITTSPPLRHFCRHTNAADSEPTKLLRSLAAMLCARLPGFLAALRQADEGVLRSAAGSADVEEVFRELLGAPLGRLSPRPDKPVVLLLDALDELVHVCVCAWVRESERALDKIDCVQKCLLVTKDK